MTNTQSKRMQLVFGLAIITLFLGMGTGAFNAKADEPKPSAADYKNLDDIKQNQKVIEKNREAHELFMAAKSWNEAESVELAKNGWCTNWSNMTLVQCSLISAAAPAEKLHGSPTKAHLTESAPVASNSTSSKQVDYKTLRLREMAEKWKGTVLEPHTVKLLAMLVVEDGTVTAERRHDCSQDGAKIYSKRLGRNLKGCFAVGIMGHNIAARGTPLVSQAAGKPWKLYDYDYAMTDFEKDYPGFSSDFRIQFAEYTLRMTQCIDSGKTVNQCIQLWNSREAGRIAKVERHMAIVESALLQPL